MKVKKLVQQAQQEMDGGVHPDNVARIAVLTFLEDASDLFFIRGVQMPNAIYRFNLEQERRWKALLNDMPSGVTMPKTFRSAFHVYYDMLVERGSIAPELLRANLLGVRNIETVTRKPQGTLNCPCGGCVGVQTCSED